MFQLCRDKNAPIPRNWNLRRVEHRKGLSESKRKRDWEWKHSANVKGPR